MEVDFLRCADLFDPAFLHDDDPVRHGQGLTLVMGHIEDRRTGGTVDVLDHPAHAQFQFGIQGTERFIHEHQGGEAYHHPGQGDPLPLATGQLPRVTVGQFRQAHAFQGLFHGFFLLLFAESFLPAAFHGEFHVLPDRHMGPQGKRLENHAQIPFLHGHHGPLSGIDLLIQTDNAAGGLQEAADDPQQGGFPAAGKPQDGDEFSCLDFQADVFKRLCLPEPLIDVFQIQTHIFGFLSYADSPAR